ncbi:hypothetical protein ACHAWU_002214 [Discostella pseudostelligera]|uniref:Uncharacterized protein n=1 Tax=Discostella pseudostelligera TaxID=259834 RepID=A0ABD3M866_9STRA
MNTKHLLPCIIDPIPSCAVWGGIFTGIDAMQGAPLSIRTWGFYASGLWLYHASICPMEAIHGRRSALHNVVAGGVMGYVGVSTGRLGVPFVNPYYLYNFRNPAIIGGAVYGALGGALAMLGGKSI